MLFSLYEYRKCFEINSIFIYIKLCIYAKLKNTIQHVIADTELGGTIFSYIYKNLRYEIAYIIYKDSNQRIQAINEEKDSEFPENTIGVIDNGIFLPIEEKFKN